MLVNNSGAEEPAAMKVAPATSSVKLSRSEMISSEGTKKSSQIMARPMNTHTIRSSHMMMKNTLRVSLVVSQSHSSQGATSSSSAFRLTRKSFSESPLKYDCANV